MTETSDTLPALASFKAVLFDLDGTLYRQGPLRLLMALELATLPLFGPSRAHRRLKAIRAFRAAQESLRHSAQADTGRRQVETAAEASGLPVAEVEAVVTEWMQERPLKYLPYCRAHGLTTFLDLLQRRSIRTGVLSDYPAEGKLRALGLEGRFAPVLCASDPEIAAFKPSPRGFHRACDVWGLTPADVLYIGDRPDVDATGAAAAGMPCVIMGRGQDGSPDAPYTACPSFERLSRVLDSR